MRVTAVRRELAESADAFSGGPSRADGREPRP